MNRLINACYGSNFENYDHLESILTQLAFANVGVELSLFSDKPEYTKRLLAQKERFNDYYITLHGPFMELEATSPEGDPRHQQMLDAMDESFSIYHYFNAHSMVIHTNQCSCNQENKLQLQQNALITLKKIAKRAIEEKVVLLIENVGEVVHQNMLFDEEEFVALFNHFSSETECLIDIGHAIINDWDIEKVIYQLRNRISAYHLHNNDGTADKHCPLFDDGMKYSEKQLKSLFHCMEKYTPGADWIFEYAPGKHVTPELMEDDVKHVLSLL